MRDAGDRLVRVYRAKLGVGARQRDQPVRVGAPGESAAVCGAGNQGRELVRLAPRNIVEKPQVLTAGHGQSRDHVVGQRLLGPRRELTTRWPNAERSRGDMHEARGD